MHPAQFVRRWKATITFTVIISLLLALLFLTAFDAYAECRERGGTFVRGVVWFTCAESS